MEEDVRGVDHEHVVLACLDKCLLDDQSLTS